MKRKIALSLTGIIAISMFAGCGSSLDVTESTMKLDSKGAILEASVEDFSQSYYDAEELSSYISSAVEEYLAGAEGKKVDVKKSEVKEGTAYLTLSYDSLATYSDFNDVEAFSGTVLDAKTAGYDFETVFVDCSGEDKSEGSVESVEATIPGDVVKQNDDLKVLIVKSDVDLIVPGEVMYVSAGNAKKTAKDTVYVNDKENETDEDVLVYVIYK